MYDQIIITLILICSIYECWILTAEYKYDEQKDIEKKQKKTKTTKRTVTTPAGNSTVEETIETSEPMEEKK